MKKAIIFFITIGLIGLIFGSCEPTVPTETKKENSKTPLSTQEKQKIDLEVTSKELCKAYEENEVKADIKYKGKYAQITGKVISISEVLGMLTVTIADDEISFPQVSLMLEDSHKKFVAELKKGDSVTVKGEIKGLGINVDISDVTFIK